MWWTGKTIAYDDLNIAIVFINHIDYGYMQNMAQQLLYHVGR
jgi:hypothetical protein